MKRLGMAAVLALAVHGVLFRVGIPWTRPVLPLAQSRAVDISLVTFQKPDQKPVPPVPEKITPLPKPKSKPRPAALARPQARTVVPPPPVSRPETAEPMDEPAPAVAKRPAEPLAGETPPETVGAVMVENAARVDQAHAAVQVSVPRYDINPPIAYPPLARRRNFEGTVLLDVRVSVDGRAVEVRLAQSSGHSVLDRSALLAVKGWRFEPAYRDAQPIETWVEVPVRFELK
jgi:protein TonB